MPRLVVSLQAQSDTTYVIRDLAAKAGMAVAAKYAASFETLFDRLLQFPIVALLVPRSLDMHV